MHNFPTFMKAAMELRDAGHFVHNPAEKDIAAGFNHLLPEDHEENAAFSLSKAFEWDFSAIIDAQAVVLLPGWRESKGAQAEVVLALALERKVCELHGSQLRSMNDTNYTVSFDK